MLAVSRAHNAHAFSISSVTTIDMTIEPSNPVALLKKKNISVSASCWTQRPPLLAVPDRLAARNSTE